MSLIFETCPTCGAKSIKPLSSDYQQEDGIVIPNLQRWQCTSCKAIYFDDAAMRRIEEARLANHPVRSTTRRKLSRTAISTENQ